MDDSKSETEAVRRYVATEIRAELGRQRLSAREAARRLGLGQTSFHQRLVGDAKIDVGELHQIARLLRVPVERFFPAAEVETGSAMGKATVPSLPVYSRSAFRSPFPVGLVA